MKGVCRTGQLMARRQFLASGAAAAIASVVPIAAPARAQAELSGMQVLSIATSAMSAARSFAGGGGGLEAMLQAQNAKLNLIINQLQTVQSALTDLQIDVRRLPDLVQGFLRASIRDQLITQIGGAAGRFATVSKTRGYDPAYVGSVNGQAELRDIMFIAMQSREALGQLPEGRGPEAASIVPLGLALEVASIGLTGFGRGRALATLDSYESWIAAMRSEQSGSVWATLADTIARHDAVIDDLATTEIGGALSIKAAKIGSATPLPKDRFRDPCSLLCAMPVKGPNPFTFSTQQIADNARPICPVGWGVERAIGQKLETTLGVQLLSYDTMWEGVVAPWQGDVCTTQEIRPWSAHIKADFDDGRLTPAMIKQQTADKQAVFEPRRATFAAKLEKANFHRARAGQCALALQILDQADKQIALFRSLTA